MNLFFKFIINSYKLYVYSLLELALAFKSSCQEKTRTELLFFSYRKYFSLNLDFTGLYLNLTLCEIYFANISIIYKMGHIRLNNEDCLYIGREEKRAARRFEFPTKKINVHAESESLLRAWYILKHENRLYGTCCVKYYLTEEKKNSLTDHA